MMKENCTTCVHCRNQINGLFCDVLDVYIDYNDYNVELPCRVMRTWELADGSTKQCLTDNYEYILKREFSNGDK